MNTQLLTIIIATSAALGLTGCGKTELKNAATPPEKGTLQTAVDGFTGKTAVDVGLKAKEQIKKASETETRNLNEAMQ